jgi:hypothetical protein
VRNLSGHEKLQGVSGASVITKVVQAFVNYFRPCLSGDIVSQVYLKLTAYL